jgi:ATP-dependent exoDNAse (exonuclease V) alpha subunit
MLAMNIDSNHVEKTPEFLRAFDMFEHSSRNIFLTGRAGTGKSTLLQYFRSSTRKNVAVVAPTGVAAVNIKGQTIHSFFNFRPDITPEAAKEIRLRRDKRELYKKLDAIIVDEVSMVRADLLDCMDAFLRHNGPERDKPFGGVQMILIGDLYQLPPVVTGADREMFTALYPSPYFFDAKVFAKADFDLLELEKIYRQKDDRFIRLLNAVRDNAVKPEDLALLNLRCRPDFDPPPEDFYIYLTTTNDLADTINRARLSAIKGKVHAYTGEIDGAFDKKSLPTHEDLQLKIGAQVMLLNNDPMGRWVNGSIGHITDIIHGNEDAIRVRLADGHDVDVAPFSWEMYKFVYDKELEKVESEIVGMFRQYPLRLAWAVTIHKSQGKTFSKVVIDVGRGTFSHGQSYVALSRCTTLDGIILKRPFMRAHIMLDTRVREFLENFKKHVRKTHLVLE